MGQFDVYEWLKLQYSLDPNKWFTPQEVTKGLQNLGKTDGLRYTRAHLIKLCVSGAVEHKDLDKHGISNYKLVFKWKPAQAIIHN